MKNLLLSSLLLAAPALSYAEDSIDFEKSIAPVLRASCIECHGSEKQKGGLRLDRRDDALKGGKNGKVIQPGSSAESELLKRITLPDGDADIMPPEGSPLSKDLTDRIKAWIDQGATWPDGFVVAAGDAPAPASTEPVPAGDHASAASLKAPPRPEPALPKDFQPGPEEASAIAALAAKGIDVRPIAQNSPWREAGFHLQGASVTDETIAPLKNLQSLIELNLAGTMVTDAGLSALAGLHHLRGLHLERTGITDAGLAHLRGLTNLLYLNLYATQVTDAGLDHLRGLGELRRLYLWQSKATAAGARTLQDALPGLDVNLGWEPPAAQDASKTNNPPATTK